MSRKVSQLFALRPLFLEVDLVFDQIMGVVVQHSAQDFQTFPETFSVSDRKLVLTGKDYLF